MVNPRGPRRASAQLLVALGIGASRLAGLGRETVASRLLGNSAAADAFAVAMRIPNMLQNLLGEGVLSASFVPVYSQLLDGHQDAALDDNSDAGPDEDAERDEDDDAAAGQDEDAERDEDDDAAAGQDEDAERDEDDDAAAGQDEDAERDEDDDAAAGQDEDAAREQHRRKQREEEAGRVAGAVAAALMTVVGIAVAALVTLARPITFVLAPGLGADRFELAVSLVRVTAVGTGFAVMSAWCLGVLNSHRRFFVSYAAPVVWNAVQVGALLVAWILAFDLDGIARALAWGVAGGGLAQLLVQLPLTIRLARGLRLRWMRGHGGLREIRRRFGPAVLGRGVVQLSAFLDVMLASLLATGAVAALYRAQMLYTLPVSLFAMSVAAAELPEMSRLAHDPAALAARARLAMRRVAFWMLLTTVVYVAAGDLVVGLLFEGGAFGSDDTVLVWFVVAAYALGLPATGVSRVLQNACYARGDTAGPARAAAVRVAVSAAVGLAAMFPLDRVTVGPHGLMNAADALGLAWALPSAERALGDTVRLGAAGLALGSAVAAWIEIGLLARLMRHRLGRTGAVRSTLAAPAGAAASAFVSAAALKLLVGDWPVLLAAPLVAGAAALVYTVTAHRSGVPEAQMLLGPARRLIWHRRG